MANRQITADTPDPLVLDMYKHLAEQSQHFNGIESTYRTLASTWLLASFGGMGFILKDLDQYKGQQALFIAAVAVAAAVGIVLLWLMDLRVYHRLLAAAGSQGDDGSTRRQGGDAQSGLVLLADVFGAGWHCSGRVSPPCVVANTFCVLGFYGVIGRTGHWACRGFAHVPVGARQKQ
jgi:hypothetical protein